MARPVRQITSDDSAIVELAQALSDLRGSARLTLRQVAEHAHYSVSALSEATSGRRLPTWELTRSFVEACGGDMDEWRKRWKYAAEQHFQLTEPEEPSQCLPEPERAKALSRAGHRTRALIAAGLVSVALLALLGIGLYLSGGRGTAPVGFAPPPKPSKAAAERHVPQWYASTPFAAAVSAAVALTGVLGTWAAIRGGWYRQELTYRLLDVVPVPVPVRQGPESRTRRPQVARVVQIQLANRGCRDIPSSAFDRDRALVVDIAVPVSMVLKTGSALSGLPGPHVRAEGTAIALQPTLIKSGEKITISVLVEGASPRITIADCPLIDTRLREHEATSVRRVQAKVLGSLAAALAIALTTFVAFTTSTAQTITTTISLASALAALGAVWTTVFEARQRRGD